MDLSCAGYGLAEGFCEEVNAILFYFGCGEVVLSSSRRTLFDLLLML
jgi:hypothetical protein